MIKSFRVGERVAAYAAFPSKGSYYSGARGTVQQQQTDGWLSVKMDGSGDTICVHPKACRRLKQPKPLRDWQIVVKPNGRVRDGQPLTVGMGICAVEPEELITVREVRPLRSKSAKS